MQPSVFKPLLTRCSRKSILERLQHVFNQNITQSVGFDAPAARPVKDKTIMVLQSFAKERFQVVINRK